MSIDYRAIRDALVSVAQASGRFDGVNSHEPKRAPGTGLWCFVFRQAVTPVRSGGLNRTTVRLAWTMQVRCDMLREPQDDIDIDVSEASDILLSELSSNFTLDIQGVRMVDLLGAYGDPLGAQDGYLLQDDVLYRISNITVPLIINNAFTQAA